MKPCRQVIGLVLFSCLLMSCGQDPSKDVDDYELSALIKEEKHPDADSVEVIDRLDVYKGSSGSTGEGGTTYVVRVEINSAEGNEEVVYEVFIASEYNSDGWLEIRKRDKNE